MKVIITVEEILLKDAEIEIPDSIDDVKTYCLNLYNNNQLDADLSVSDATLSDFNVEVIKESHHE